MNAIDLLITRQSTPQLIAPSPDKTDLELILTAGMRVPDHAGLLPFHFTVVQNEGLTKLSDIFVQAIKPSTTDQAKLDKTAKMPFRAPLIVVVSTQYQRHDKVPKHEQLITAGCCVHAMQMASVALGYGAMWRTGDLSLNDHVKQALSIDLHEDIVGFLYIGTQAKSLPLKPTKLYDDRVSYL
ncbi:NAD(P)H nitroreductase [Thalassotalea castellviae]|uniref:Putative NAD(P)H nitroreductase n=1 Tax=Thalassotalea castellviae TaxID=3075612 RepID=A0ABU2ZVT5_9GAMM|nr:NAD(P)H nitroreductase [Thalassotalea sp. W431]MDT0602046.1 NAD(P)H nitroreductase [Thalassotalea sp. W431]